MNIQPRALIVDRNPKVRGELLRLFLQRGYQTRAVGSRRQGYELLDELSPDVLVLDDPGQGKTYRLVWLRETEYPDTRVDLLELNALSLSQQLASLLPPPLLKG